MNFTLEEIERMKTQARVIVANHRDANPSMIAAVLDIPITLAEELVRVLIKEGSIVMVPNNGLQYNTF